MLDSIKKSTKLLDDNAPIVIKQYDNRENRNAAKEVGKTF